MKTRCAYKNEHKDMVEKQKRQDDLKLRNEEEVAPWPRVWISKEEAKEMWPDKQEQALDELVSQAQELGLYEDSYGAMLDDGFKNEKCKEKDDMKIELEVVEIANKDIEAEMKRMPKFMTQAEIDALDEIDKTHLP